MATESEENGDQVFDLDELDWQQQQDDLAMLQMQQEDAEAALSEPVEEDDEEAVRAWKEDMTKMSHGTRLLFVNDFAGAEQVFRSGMMNERSGGMAGLRDLRGAFALQYALVSVIKGVASLANDQLDECLQRLWYAEKLAAEDGEWLGKSVVRGICTLMGGVIQCLQHSFVKGVYNVLKSWLWIKVLRTKGLQHRGKEREVVRSCALFTLGIFNLLLSLLPSSMLRAATLLSGFEGDREHGLAMLLSCWREEGMFSPWGALVWVAYNVDTKTFLDESLSASELRECQQIFKWAHAKYPASVFFSGIEADFEACRRNVPLAMTIIDRAAPYATELKALEWALNYKRGVYDLTELQFAAAAAYFEASLQVYVRVGRRSMVPFMAMYAALCYHVVADRRAKLELERDVLESSDGEQTADDAEELDGMDAATAAAHAEEMLSLVAKYKAMDKDNWGRQDRWAFNVYGAYDANDSVWPLLDLVECMIWRMRCTRWMADDQAAALLDMLQQEAAERGAVADDQVRICGCFAQVLLERNQRESSFEWCERGLKLEPELSAEGREGGFIGMLYYLKALNLKERGQLLSAKYFLDKVGAFNPKGGSWLQHYTMFKSNILNKLLTGDRLDEEYDSRTVPAGSTVRHVVQATVGTAISWDWSVSKHDLQFTCIFRPGTDDGDIQMLASVERHAASEGPCVGYFVPDRPGDIIFEWDNRYSFMRAKDLLFRVVELEHEEDESSAASAANPDDLDQDDLDPEDAAAADAAVAAAAAADQQDAVGPGGEQGEQGDGRQDADEENHVA